MKRSFPGSRRTKGQLIAAITATPSVGPSPSTSASVGSSATSRLVGTPATIAANPRKTAIWMTLLTIGANIGTANFPCALSSAAATAANPNSAICGANSRSSSVATSWNAALSAPSTREE